MQARKRKVWLVTQFEPNEHLLRGVPELFGANNTTCEIVSLEQYFEMLDMRNNGINVQMAPLEGTLFLVSGNTIADIKVGS